MEAVRERLLSGGQRSILSYLYAGDRFETPWHYHPQLELTLILESSGTRLVGDHVGGYEVGEIVLLGSHLPHCWRDRPTADVRARSVVTQWNPGIFASVPELGRVQSLLGAASRGLRFQPGASSELCTCVLALPELRETKLYLGLLGVLERLCAYEAEPLSTMAYQEVLPDEDGRRLAQVQAFLAQSYSRKITLEEVATLVHMRAQSFSRFFSRMMGRPFFSYLNEYRCQQASRLLLETERTATEIGYACGYESSPFFFRQFRRYFGASPGVYRRRYCR